MAPVIKEPVPVGGRPVTCSLAGPGQSAFIDGIRSLGFDTVPLESAEDHLRRGKPVLFHGYRGPYGRLADKYPGLVSIVWHSGYTGSDVMAEGEILASALERSRRGNLHLLWLERRDVLPEGARYLAPVWDPIRMAALIQVLPRKKSRSVMVAFQGEYPRAAKNILASLAGCARTGASLHISASSLKDKRGAGAKEILHGVDWTSYNFLPRENVVRLAASCEVMCHVSITDTWPYLVMEAVYAGTPAVLSDAIAWTSNLPAWAQDLCIVRPHTSSEIIRKKVAYLLDHVEDRNRLAVEQRACLDRLAKSHLHEASTTLASLGFSVLNV